MLLAFQKAPSWLAHLVLLLRGLIHFFIHKLHSQSSHTVSWLIEQTSTPARCVYASLSLFIGRERGEVCGLLKSFRGLYMQLLLFRLTTPIEKWLFMMLYGTGSPLSSLSTGVKSIFPLSSITSERFSMSLRICKRLVRRSLKGKGHIISYYIEEFRVWSHCAPAIYRQGTDVFVTFRSK